MKNTWTQSILRKNSRKIWPGTNRRGPGQSEAKSKPIGSVLKSYTLSNAVDLLVMGAYGHSRLRQFILGGATKSLLSKPPLPILFSH